MQEGTPIIIKKKKVSGHGHHGGAWKVAYADFVTAMMAFFLVMWIMGMSADEREQVAGYFNDPMGFMKSMPKGGPNIGPSGGRRSVSSDFSQGNASRASEEKRSEREELEELEGELQKSLAAGTGDASISNLLKAIHVVLTSEGLEIEFAEGMGVVFFELGSATVRPQARALMLRMAPLLAKSRRVVMVDGHTDAKPYSGPHFDNWDLSADRAQAVRRILKAGGVPTRQLVAVRGFADTRLKFPDRPLDPRNRRVTVLLPFSSVTTQVSEDIPAAAIRPDTQGAFRRPVEVVPPSVDLREPDKVEDPNSH